LSVELLFTPNIKEIKKTETYGWVALLKVFCDFSDEGRFAPSARGNQNGVDV
jgi:hypothetical protein